MIDLDVASNGIERAALQLFAAMEDGRTGEGIAELCKPEFVWENSGLPAIRGMAGYRDLASGGGFGQFLPILATMRSFSVDLLHIASSGDEREGVVFTERIDHHWDGDGRDLMTPHIAGVIEVSEGKILALRDFYDVAVYDQTPTAPDPAHAS